MNALVYQEKDVKYYFLHVFHYAPKLVPNYISDSIPFKTSMKYRDAALWRLLCLEDRVDTADLAMYWEIMDMMTDISVESAIKLLEYLYEYKVRKLSRLEKRQAYPEITNDLYRQEYADERGVYRDVCTGTLINEAIDLLQEEAERFVRS